MKRFVAVILAVLMIGALLAACGDSTVTAKVEAKYDDGFAKGYADKVTTDEDGAVIYEFTSEKYEDYIYEHKNSVADDINDQVVANHSKDFGQYTYINTEKQAVIIGLNAGEYDESYAKAEAPSYAETAFLYFKNLETPVSTIKVIYCNANDQDEIYGSFEFTAD